MGVVVSGVGLITPLGSSREATWSALIKGQSGIRPTKKGLEAPVLHFSPNGARSRCADMALLAAEEAFAHAGFDRDALKGQSVGCMISQTKPLLDETLNATLLISSFSGWSVEIVVRNSFQLSGPSLNITAACASGVASLQTGQRLIESGVCSVVLAGAAESSLFDLYRAGFRNLGVLVRGDNPEAVCPFDQNRRGFAMGEGAGLLVLEEEAHCRGRGHRPLVRINNVILQNGNHDAVQFEENAESIANLLKKICDDQIPDYINAHGTGTRLNDKVESKGIRTCLKENADRVWISSTKSATGHLLGAAGAVEAVFSVLALRDQVMPGTVHLKEKDPECDLLIACKSKPARLLRTVSLSYGFGGQMGGVCFEKI